MERALSVSRCLFVILSLVSNVYFGTAADLQDVADGKPDPTPKPTPKPTPSHYVFEKGSPDLCPQKAAWIQSLPGYGWDNLQNKEMATIYDPNYTKCRLTTDRKYLIPDGVQVHSQKSSNVKVYAEMIEHFSDYKSTRSNSINVDVGISLHIASISASFSRDHQTAKEHMVRDKAVTVRSQCRYVYYTMQNEPDAPLSPSLKKRFYEVASAIQSNHTETVRYLSDLIVRDFGTHVINKVDIGAAIVKEDQLKERFVKDHSSDSTAIKVSASASFLGIFHASSSYSTNTSHEKLTWYSNNVTNSEVNSYGGPSIGGKLSLDTWLAGVPDNLVTMDRSGDPLWFLVTPTNLPELPVDTVRALADVVEEAVLSYYQHNAYRGCMNIDSPNFSYMANIDDGTCKGPETNYTFGGIYQSCAGGECVASSTQKNPLTGGYTCPAGYRAVPIYSRKTVNCHRKCHHFWFIRYNCYDDCGMQYTADYKAYWCVNTQSVKQSSGYMFGGVYTDRIKNPLTGTTSCPAEFNALHFGTNPRMSVCVSDDYELGFKFSVPFAGFYTCSDGNPLALSSEPLSKMVQGVPSGGAGEQHLKLSNFLYLSGEKKWPKGCPKGYSQHLLTNTESGCAIHYCVQYGALSVSGLPPIKRPPFSIKPEVLRNATRLLATSSGTILSRTGDAMEWTKVTSWSDLQESQNMQPMIDLQQADYEKSQAKGFSQGATVAITVLGTAVVGILLIVGVMGCRSYRKRRRNDALVPWGMARPPNYSNIGGDNAPNTDV